MKELFEKLIGFIPAYFSDLLGLVAGPKRFLRDRLGGNEKPLEKALTFMGISFALSWIIKAPLTRVDPLVELGTDAVFILASAALYGGAICLAWRLVGGKVEARRFFTNHFYLTGVLLIIIACFYLATMGVIRAGDPTLYKQIYDAAYGGNLPLFYVQNADRLVENPTYRASMVVQLAGFASYLGWFAAGWGGYRELSASTRLQSAVAATLFAILCVPVAAITFLIANALMK